MNNYKSKILKSFNTRASTYDKYSLIQKEVSVRMIEKLKFIKISPKNILDLGCGTGYLSLLLKKLYPNVHITCLDFSPEMLSHCKLKESAFETVCADIEDLPFKKPQYDIIVSGLTLHWCKEIEKIFYDIYNILNENGIFIFTTVGPDTLSELKETYKLVDDKDHINIFHDMHTYGDLLLNIGFDDPVVDVEKIIMEYSSVQNVFNSIKKIGANTLTHSHRNKLTKSMYKKIVDLYPKTKKMTYPVTYEVIYGTSWKKIKKPDKKSSNFIEIKKL